MRHVYTLKIWWLFCEMMGTFKESFAQHIKDRSLVVEIPWSIRKIERISCSCICFIVRNFTNRSIWHNSMIACKLCSCWFVKTLFTIITIHHYKHDWPSSLLEQAQWREYQQRINWSVEMCSILNYSFIDFFFTVLATKRYHLDKSLYI